MSVDRFILGVSTLALAVAAQAASAPSASPVDGQVTSPGAVGTTAEPQSNAQPAAT